MGLFWQIIDEASDIDQIDHYTLTGLGEPLLDPHIIERLEYIRENVPDHSQVDLYTNGSFLTEEKTKALIRAGVDVIYVSLNAISAEKRSAVMRLDDYDKVVGYIHKAIELSKGTRTKVIVKALAEKDLMDVEDPQIFLQQWGGPHDRAQGDGHAYLHLEGNWAGEMWPMRIKPVAACSRALNEIMVLWDGRVSLCCFDGEGEVIFGDLNNSTIRDIFKGEMATSYRLAHVEGRRQELKLCAGCSTI